MPLFDMSSRVIDPRERTLASSLTMLAVIGGAIVLRKRSMSANMSLDVS